MNRIVWLIALVAVGLAIPVTLQHHAQSELRHEMRVLRDQVSVATHLASDNQRLSNVVSQFRVAQSKANDQAQELLRLRAEMIRLKQQGQSNSLAQSSATNQAVEVARLRDQVTRLTQENEELASLRDEVLQLRAAMASAAVTEAASNTPAQETEDSVLGLRIIRTRGPTFAEKLKRSVSAQDDESFQSVFSRFLQVNGISTNSIAAAAYDDRTGRVIIRAPQATLDQVEQVTRTLDNAP